MDYFAQCVLQLPPPPHAMVMVYTGSAIWSSYHHNTVDKIYQQLLKGGGTCLLY